MPIMFRLAAWAAGASAAFAAAASAHAAAIISNGTIQLGVDDFGQLNPTSVLGDASPVTGTTVVGLRYLPTGNESTSHGCLCEGWGVGIGETGAFGSANNNFGGAANLTPVSFVSDGVTATSVVELTSGELRITHHFAPAAETSDLYRVTVTIENISGVDITDLRYTRTFDWDVEPTTFSEFVTHAGVATTPSVLLAINNGFVDSNPFGFRSDLGATGDFVDFGPDDHGSNFDFGFGALAAGESFSFDIFYGASLTEAAALAALGAVAAELFSLGQCDIDADGTGAFTAGGFQCNTFIFGFAGVGGEVIVPPPGEIPVPAALPMFLTALLGGAGLMRRRRRQAAAATGA
ncbi:MAG: hypothetical protein Kow00133_17890 [Amphiplicatus sp.]